MRLARRTPHGASCLVHAMCIWSMATRRAPSRRSKDARFIGLNTTTSINWVHPTFPFFVVAPQTHGNSRLSSIRPCPVSAVSFHSPARRVTAGVPPGSHAYGQNPVAPQPGMGGESRGDAPAQGSRGEKLNHPEDSAHGAEGNGSVQSGMGDNGGRTCGEDGGGGGEKDGVFAAEADDERSDRASPMFPLLSPPRAEPGHAAGPAGGGRLSPSVGMTPSTVQLGLLNSVSPSMLLGPGAGAWLGATGGVGGGTGGFGMSAAAPSFVQTSQLAPFLLSQMGPHGSFGRFMCRERGEGGRGEYSFVAFLFVIWPLTTFTTHPFRDATGGGGEGSVAF